MVRKCVHRRKKTLLHAQLVMKVQECAGRKERHPDKGYALLG
jgi:hypothetical protein